jgi:catabolite regulation protein CreA
MFCIGDVRHVSGKSFALSKMRYTMKQNKRKEIVSVYDPRNTLLLYLIVGAIVVTTSYKENISGLKNALETRDCGTEHAKQE